MGSLKQIVYQKTTLPVMNLLASLVLMAFCLVGVPAPVARPFLPPVAVDALVDQHFGGDVLRVGRMLGTVPRRDDAIAPLVEGPPVLPVTRGRRGKRTRKTKG